MPENLLNNKQSKKMKSTNSFLLICVFSLFSCILSKAEPIVIRGKIILMASPCVTEPCLPGAVFGIETGETNYVIAVSSQWIVNDLIIDNTKYIVDDKVEVTGIVSVKQDLNSTIYNEIEVLSIEKITSNIPKINTILFSIRQTAEDVVISFESAFCGNVKLYNLLGKVCFEQNSLNESSVILSKQSIPSGYYILSLSDSKNKKTARVKIIF
ncbi:MAG: T9SS type A sorting domain-containing protein [Dysgonamonadaceae bacterium]|jgi:hypothetical protein|nr:T9SS type A sorting domain-containing protein [Dysgonamonadaceae bacterium]